jgi:hypothetical protein
MPDNNNDVFYIGLEDRPNNPRQERLALAER